MTRIVTDEELSNFLSTAQRIVDQSYGKFAKDFANPTPPVLLLDNVTKRTKYARIYTDNGTQRMVWGFLRLEDGDVLKAAGWKAPALNFARGNIYSHDWYDRAAWTGIS